MRILLPGFSDHRMILYASRARYTELLEAGVKLYESKDRLLHAKTAVIDGLWSTVGSSNLDYFRQMRLFWGAISEGRWRTYFNST
ncbi:MAG: hypothetical protein C4291_01815 [Candidatus Dadabacteria bacterium]